MRSEKRIALLHFMREYPQPVCQRENWRRGFHTTKDEQQDKEKSAEGGISPRFKRRWPLIGL